MTALISLNGNGVTIVSQGVLDQGDREVKFVYGHYRSVEFVCKHWSWRYPMMGQGDKAFTYYIFIDPERAPEELFTKPTDDDEDCYYDNYLYNTDFSQEVYFHGGITFCEMTETGARQVGCDFQHMFDNNDNLTPAEFGRELKRTINSFLELHPEYETTGSFKLYARYMYTADYEGGKWRVKEIAP